MQVVNNAPGADGVDAGDVEESAPTIGAREPPQVPDVVVPVEPDHARGRDHLQWPAVPSAPTETGHAASAEAIDHDVDNPTQPTTDEEITRMSTDAEQKMDQAIETFRPRRGPTEKIALHPSGRPGQQP